MAGSTGQIVLSFYYPRELSEEQWITVSVNGEPEIYLNMDQDQVETTLQMKPYEVVDLELETNFYVPDAQEQRGERRLAVLMQIQAD